MLGLPKTTELNRRIPKQKFYEKLTVTAPLKRAFIEQIKEIYWRNVIATRTVNLGEGKTVKEIEVFEVRLTSPKLDMAVLKLIDKEVPYHIVFLLEHKGKFQAWTAYKETALSGDAHFKVGTYYHTDWLFEHELPLKMEGLNIDAVYENFVRQIGGNDLFRDSSEPLKESVERNERRRVLEKKIKQWETKVRKEKQINKQIKFNIVLKKFRKELENYNES